jgi:MerR family copper efflux transcriptional regulator
MERLLTVGQLAHTTGVPTKTIRYYEQVGVLPAPRRSPAGYRQYTRRDVNRLLFVRRGRALGLPLKDLKTLTAELDNGRCGTMRPQLSNLIQVQLQTVRQRIAEFQLLRLQLEQILHQTSTQPALDPAERCQCLDLDAAPTREGTPHSCTSILGEKPMDTQNPLEAFTIVPTTSGNGETHCRCGCDCELPLTQLSRPKDALGRIGDEENEPAKQQ